MTSDINILGDITNSQPALAMDGTFLVGSIKLVQKILILLLTDVETDPFGRGTRIPSLAGMGTVDMGQLEGIFRIAMTDVKVQLDASYLADTPDDEKLEIINVELSRLEPDYIQAVLVITTQDGETTTIELPKSLIQIQEAS